MSDILTLAQNLVNTLTPDYIKKLDKSEKKENIQKLKEYGENSQVKQDTTLRQNIKKDVRELTTNLNCNPTDQFNEMILAAREKQSCDEQCQFRKKAHMLREKCMEAKKYESIDEEKALVECKKFFIFAHGQEAWDKHREKELSEKADHIISKFKERIKKERKEILHNIDTYNSQFENSKNVIDLYKKLRRENIALKKNIKVESNDVLTSDRKTVYEEQGIESLRFYYFIMIFIYVIIVIVFLISMAFFPSSFELKKQIGFFIGICLLPFISPTILSVIISILYSIYDIIPKNVRLSITK
jgi:hypothetical protein